MSESGDNPYGAERVRQSLIHFVFGKGAAAIVGVALLLLVVRALPADEYGIYIALLAVLEITQLSSNFGLFAAAYRYVPELRSKGHGAALHGLLIRLSAFRLLTLISAVLIIALLVQPISHLLHLQGYEYVFVLYTLVIVAEGFARYLDILFDSLLLQRYSQIAILVRNGLRLVGLVMAMTTHSVEITLLTWVGIELMASGVGAVCSAAMLFKYSSELKKRSPGLPAFEHGARRYFGFAGPSYFAQLFGLVYGPETAKLILAKVGGVLQVGAFGFAAAVGAMIQRYLPVFLLLGLVRPLFVATHDSKDRNNQLNKLTNIVLKLNLFVLFPMMAFVLASGNQLASILSGGKFQDAGSFLVFFMVLLVLQTWHAVLGLVTLAIEDGVSGLHGTVLGLAGLLAGLAFLSAFGTYSLCVGLVLSEVIWCVYVHFSLSRKGLVIKNDWLGTAKIIIASGIGLLIAEIVCSISNNSQLITIIMELIIIGSIFVVLSYVIKPFSSEERNLINRMLPRPIFVW